MTELETGEQEIETKLAESMIKNGYAEEVKSKPNKSSKDK